MRDYALVHVNGVRHEVRGREALMMLADWLRREAGLTGTKTVCSEGDCGSCTVLRAMPQPGCTTDFLEAPPLEFEAVNSCIATVAQMDGSHIVTVEGMQCGAELSPAQEAMKTCHASQCGYCTPGFVMAMSAMLERHNGIAQPIGPQLAANYLTGNLCRCTGYVTILEAALAVKATKQHSVARRYSNPAAVQAGIAAAEQSLLIEHDGVCVCAPVTVREACSFAATHPGFRVLGAATDLGVQINKGKPLPRAILSLHLIPDLYEMKQTRNRWRVGARVSLATIRRMCEESSPELSRFLNLFASPQIKNVATLVGNVANASPIGDTLPFLLISDGQVHVASRPGGKGPLRQRTIAMTDLYTGYKTLALEPGEIITHVSFANPEAKEMVRLSKVSMRKDLDISAVSAAFSCTLQKRGRSRKPPVIESARIAYGGVAATPIRLPEIEEALEGEVTAEKIESLANRIADRVKPLSDVRGSAAYRRVLAANLFRRFGAEVLLA